MDKSELIQCTTDVTSRDANIQFSKTAGWAHLETNKAFDFIQLQRFVETYKSLDPVHRQAKLTRTEVKCGTINAAVIKDLTRSYVADHMVVIRENITYQTFTNEVRSKV